MCDKGQRQPSATGNSVCRAFPPPFMSRAAVVDRGCQCLGSSEEHAAMRSVWTSRSWPRSLARGRGTHVPANVAGIALSKAGLLGLTTEVGKFSFASAGAPGAATLPQERDPRDFVLTLSVMHF